MDSSHIVGIDLQIGLENWVLKACLSTPEAVRCGRIRGITLSDAKSMGTSERTVTARFDAANLAVTVPPDDGDLCCLRNVVIEGTVGIFRALVGARVWLEFRHARLTHAVPAFKEQWAMEEAVCSMADDGELCMQL